MRRGERIAGRFEVAGDPRVVEHNLADFWRSRHAGARRDEDAWWLAGTELATGAPVRIASRRHPAAWYGDVVQEAIARELMALALPGVVPVLHAGPGVVHAMPPEAGPRPILGEGDAKECAVAVAYTMAHLHGLGYAGLPFGPRHLRVIESDGRWEVAWVLPEVEGLAAIEPPAGEETAPVRPRRVAERIADDMRAFKRFVASLLPPSQTLPPKLLAIADARSAVGYLLVLSPAEMEELPRALSLPRGDPLVAGVIAAGEERLARYAEVSTCDPYVGLPLAAAYHKRAAAAFERRELAAALQDVERALRLDGFGPYHTTRAIILSALGRTAEARAAIEAGLADIDRGGPSASRVTDVERARAYATRGAIAVQEQELPTAERAHRRALELHETAAHAHALGGVLFARGELAAASEFEARAVALAPNEVRYRWALAVSLHRLGRHEEALEQGRAMVALGPDVPLYRERLARLERPRPSPWWRFWERW